MHPHIKPAIFLATNFLFLQSAVALAQEHQAIAIPQLQTDINQIQEPNVTDTNNNNNNNNNNPIQVIDPSEQTSYISPNSPTAILTPSSTGTSTLGQLVICTTLTGENEALYGASSECRTYAALTSFASLTGAAATAGILTASETRSGVGGVRTTVSQTMVTGTRTGTATRETGAARPTETAQSESGAETGVGSMGLWTMIATAGLMVVGLVGM